MARYKRFTLSYVVNLAVLGLVFSSPVFAVVTYDGTDGIYQNILFSNSTQACISCHDSSIPYDNTSAGSPWDVGTVGGPYIYGELRHSAADGVNVDTYAATQLLNPYYIDGTTVAEGIYNRVIGDTMPMLPDPDINTYGTYPTVVAPLSTAEKNLVTGWKNGGYVQRAAPEVDTYYTATSLGKYSGTIWSRHKENGVNTWLGIRYDNDNDLSSEYIQQFGFGYTGSGGDDVYTTWQSRTLTNLTCGTTYYMQGWSYNSVYGYTPDASVESFTTVACPSISTTSLSPAQENVLYTTSVSSLNSGPTAIYSLTTAPAGMTINSSSGQISWTPYEAASNYQVNVTVQVTDGTTPGSKAFVLDVSAVSDPPVITEGISLNDSMPENTTRDIALNATDIDFNTLTWTEESPPANGSIVITGSGYSTTVSYTPNFNYYGSDSFQVRVTDGNSGFDTIQINMIITSDDYDHDGVSNATDNCPNTAPGDQTDTNNDGEGNLCDDDDDGDGMPDTFENDNGLNPLVDDSADDADGDGVSNLDEYIGGTDVNLDQVDPIVTPPADMVVNATGHLTAVELGDAAAFDIKDGILVPTASKTGTFESGRHTVTWSATDKSLNTGTADQVVDVLPIVNFSVDQSAAEGSTVDVNVELSGDAAEYPVNIDYSISGDADSSDSDAVAGSIIISSGRQGSVSVSINDDGVADAGEQIIFAITAASNAVIGENKIHQITIVESNIAPAVRLSISQSAEDRSTIFIDQGAVTVTALASDVNPGDVLNFDWSQTSAELIAVNSNGLSLGSFVFDPATLTADNYRLDVSVSDGIETSHVALSLKIEASAPVLTTADTDNDGITDDVEGVQDSDKDGIEDYLDAISQPNILQSQTGNLQNQLLLQTEAGLQVVVGQYALSASRKGAGIVEDDIVLATGLTTLPGLTINGETNIYDFEIHGLNSAQSSAYVVLPLQVGLQSGVDFYIYDGNNGWQLFTVNATNAISSAAVNESGYCSVPSASSYSAGMTVLDYCVQLLVEDGGPNDADHEVNGVVRITGAVAYSQDNAADDDPKPANIGMLGPVLLAIISLLLLPRRRRWM